MFNTLMYGYFLPFKPSSVLFVLRLSIPDWSCLIYLLFSSLDEALCWHFNWSFWL